MTDITSAAYAAQLDAQDPLRSFRGRFVHDDSDLIYLDGDSLGRHGRCVAGNAAIG